MTLGSLVLVPLDGSPFAEQALPLAHLVARRAGGSLVLAHVVQPPMPVTDVQGALVADPRTTLDLRREAQAYLDGIVARVGGADARARGLLLEGDAVHALHDAAVAHGADLIVVASHDRSALGRLLFGSVAEQLARAPGTPVLIVRRHDPPRETDDVVGREAPPIRHVLAPLDGTPESETALAPALELARLFDASVTLLTVHDPRRDRVETLLPTAVLDVGGGGEHRPVDAGAESPGDPDAYVVALARRLAADGHRVDARVERAHDVPEAIVRCAADLGADLIAMSTHGRGAWGRLLHGAVAEAVLHRVLLPVLLMRPRPTPGAEAVE